MEEESRPAGVECGERFTPYPELLGNVARVARGYAELGVGAGARVALLLRNDIPFIEASLAAAVLAASPVPVNWHWKPDEVAYLLTDSGASALVAHADLLRELDGAIPEGLPVVSVPTPPDLAAAHRIAPDDGDPPPGTVDWRAWLAELEPWDLLPDRSPLSVIYTSGTTGRPKGVERQPYDEDTRARATALIDDVFALRPGARTIVPAPLYHTAPNVVGLGCAMRGIDMILMPRFDAAEMLAHVERQRTTTIQVVPTMLVRLLQLPAAVRERHDLSSLERIVHAAAPCPPDVKRAAIDWLGPIVTEYYGCTETGILTFCTSEEWLAHPGTVGRPVEGATVKVLGPDGGELPPGEPGDVFGWFEAWPDFTYRGDPAKRAAIGRGRLVTCGDIGYLDADGFLHLLDRRNDMVISGGVNVYPAEIEAVLITLPGVRDCAVFGIPDDRFGEALCAYVEADPEAGLDADAVREHLRARLADYKVPRVVEFRDELPREDSGKIFKRRLREPYWADRDKRIA